MSGAYLRTPPQSSGVFMINKKGISTFFSKIKPANIKHKIKYETFKKTGTIPLTNPVRR